MQTLLSLPPSFVEVFAELENKALPDWVPSCDPPDMKLGSGGGSSHLLVDAWQKTGANHSFSQWLNESKKLMVHAGGQSRRLPAYAPGGKLGVPIPVFRWARGQTLDQTLMDLQLPFYQKLLSKTDPNVVAMVASGDVLLRGALDKLPTLPQVDVLCIGMWVAAEQAQHHGVFFCPKKDSTSLAFFRQKPDLETIRAYADNHVFQIDTGIWFLSERAIRVLMGKCGWSWTDEVFANGQAVTYELYADFGLSLGQEPTRSDKDIADLSCAVVPLPEGEFYHFGTSRELIHSCAALQNSVLDQRRVGATMLKPHPEMFVLNAPISSKALKPENHTLWIENACVTDAWTLNAEHVITGVPENDWTLHVPAGMCLDMVPVDDKAWCVRVYGMQDVFKGAVGDPETRWCNRPAQDWFAERHLRLKDTLDAETDIQQAALFPLFNEDELSEAMLQWLLDPNRVQNPKALRKQWLQGEKLSAEQLGIRTNLRRVYRQRLQLLRQVLPTLAKQAQRNVFYSLDLGRTAQGYAETSFELPALAETDQTDLMKQVHHEMFVAAVQRLRQQDGWADHEANAFELLQKAVVATAKDQVIQPINNVLDDQIIWGRAPVRLDLAGGWTDTPPHCLIYGGKVVNIAVELNGQPPIQVFARRCEEPHIVMRSIDLGIEQCVTTYAGLQDTHQVGSGFSIAKAAFCLCGFAPDFNGRAFQSLSEQLQAFGGGIEVSLLAAVPKGSGLGTSSILAATLLGTLGDLCGLNWSHGDISARVLVLEQMLTTGGGWQDQVGGITRGLKLVETEAGLSQTPVIRWLPDHLFTDTATRECMLLYYTGITRVAKNILQEIVRGMFLNSGQHETTLQALEGHAESTYDVLLREDWEGLGRCIHRSWELNQQLDSGTNPSETQAILDLIEDYLAGAKLLGAGGGGYMLMLAKDAQAAQRIRQILTDNPPNGKARFVDFRISTTGLEVTRS